MERGGVFIVTILRLEGSLYRMDRYLAHTDFKDEGWVVDGRKDWGMNGDVLEIRVRVLP